MLGCCHNSLKGFRWARSQRMGSYQHLGSSLVSSVHNLSHVSHFSTSFIACPQSAPSCHLLVQQTPLEMGSSFSKALFQPQQGTQHSVVQFVLPLLMRWKQSVPHLHYSSFFPHFASRACGTSASQLPAPEFGPSFLILFKSRWFFPLNWKRKIIPTHPVSMAAGISLKN